VQENFAPKIFLTKPLFYGFWQIFFGLPQRHFYNPNIINHLDLPTTWYSDFPMDWAVDNEGLGTIGTSYFRVGFGLHENLVFPRPSFTCQENSNLNFSILYISKQKHDIFSLGR